MLRTYVWLPCWRIVFSTFPGCMSSQTAWTQRWTLRTAGSDPFYVILFAMMTKDELIIQLIKIALGIAIGAYFVWWSLEVLHRLPSH
jgi:hypothetical protein